jgi:hypothetical protein
MSGSGMSFEEKKRKRAARFGIAVVASPTIEKKTEKGNGKQTSSSASPSKKQKQEKVVAETKTAVPEKAKEVPLLSKEEIEKRLKRAGRFNTGDDKTDELKAMLRKYRFKEANGEK